MSRLSANDAARYLLLGMVTWTLVHALIPIELANSVRLALGLSFVLLELPFNVIEKLVGAFGVLAWNRPTVGRSLYLRSMFVDHEKSKLVDFVRFNSVHDRILRHMARVAPPEKAWNKDRFDFEDITFMELGRTKDVGVWLPKIRARAEQAKLIVVCPSISREGGVIEELEMLVREKLLTQTIVILPPPTESFLADWRALQAKYQANRELSAFTRSVLDMEPSKDLALLGWDSSAPIGRESSDNPRIHTWDAEVSKLIVMFQTQRLREEPDEREEPVPPIQDAIHVEVGAVVLGMLVGPMLVGDRYLAVHLQSLSAFAFSAVLAFVFFVFEAAWSLERNWRLRAALNQRLYFPALVAYLTRVSMLTLMMF